MQQGVLAEQERETQQALQQTRRVGGAPCTAGGPASRPPQQRQHSQYLVAAAVPH